MHYIYHWALHSATVRNIFVLLSLPPFIKYRLTFCNIVLGKVWPGKREKTILIERHISVIVNISLAPFHSGKIN